MATSSILSEASASDLHRLCRWPLLRAIPRGAKSRPAWAACGGAGARCRMLRGFKSVFYMPFTRFYGFLLGVFCLFLSFRKAFCYVLNSPCLPYGRQSWLAWAFLPSLERQPVDGAPTGEG